MGAASGCGRAGTGRRDCNGRSFRPDRGAGCDRDRPAQRLFLPHPLIVQAFNLYYDVLHFPVLIGCLIWLWVRHRARYVRRRTTLAAFTAACLLIQLVPVAPPRMLPATGLVDTAVLYHQSVYQTRAGFNADQLSAMPSVHVGWAILVAIMVIPTLRSRWRWLASLYPVATTLAVVVTANHFWLDGIVAGLLLALVLLVQHAVSRARARWASMRLLPYRPAWDHHHNGDPAGTGGSNGHNGSAADPERTPARCYRPS